MGRVDDRDRCDGLTSVSPARKHRPLVRSLTGWKGILLAVAALAILAMASAAWADAWGAAHGRGIAGTFTATQGLPCPPKGRIPPPTCSWEGIFSSDDGSVTEVPVLLSANAAERAGDTVRTLYPGPRDPSVVYLAEGDTAWVDVAVTVVITGVYLVAVAVAGVVRARKGWREPKRPRHTPQHRQTPSAAGGAQVGPT